MNKRHHKISQSRIRAIRNGLKKLKGRYPNYLKDQYSPEQNKLLDKKFVDGSTYSACLVLLQRSDKWLLRAFNMFKALDHLATCRGVIDFWLHDQRLIVHYLIHGQIVLSEKGLDFYEDTYNKTIIQRYLRNIEQQCRAYETRNLAIQK